MEGQKISGAIDSLVAPPPGFTANVDEKAAGVEPAAIAVVEPVVAGAEPVVVAGEGKKPGEADERSAKRRRGRPRKAEVVVDGGILMSPAAPASAPAPASATELVVSPLPATAFSGKRGRGRPRGSGRLQQLASIGGDFADTAGGGITPHVLLVDAGEDVVAKISLISARNPQAIVIISGNGQVANVTLRKHCANAGILKYEGTFEIISLSGSYVSSGTTSGNYRRIGTINILLATPRGEVFGGKVEGSLIAATPVQIILGCFKQNVRSDIKKVQPIAIAVENMPAQPNPTELTTGSIGSSENVTPAAATPEIAVPATNNNNVQPPSSSNGEGDNHKMPN